VLLPSNQHPPDTSEKSMRNLAYPLDWQAIFSYIGFPAYFKPHAGGGWKHVYRVKSAEELLLVYGQTGDLVMMLQEEIVFSEYFRCYSIGRKDVSIMRYDPRQPHHLRYVQNPEPIEPRLYERLHGDVMKLNLALGYDFNTVELAVRDGIPYAIDFCNPAPDADLASIGRENFEWVVEAAANLAIERAREYTPGQARIEWGEFVTAKPATPQTAETTAEPVPTR